MPQSLRKIRALKLPGTKPSMNTGALPEFRQVNPESLMVDDTYQRNLSDNSLRLIRKIVSKWNWNSFKPPVAVEVDGSLHLLDGQHTATAAASHPEISAIPVMVVPATTESERANAFVRHNKNRLQVTPMQLFYSRLAAGDDAATNAHMALVRAGVTLLKSQPAKGIFKDGETLAATTLIAIVNRRYPIGLRKILTICKEGKLKPISADSLKAVEALLFEPEYSKIDTDRLPLTIMKEGEDAGGDVPAMKAAHNMPKWKALAAIWYRKTKKKSK